MSDRRSHRVHTAQDQRRAIAAHAGSAESGSQRDRIPLQKSGRQQTAALHLRAEIQSGDQTNFQSRRIKTAGYSHKPTTREEEKRCSTRSPHRIWLAEHSSEICTNRSKTSNLVGALSGHKEGRKAFARYRAIDDEMKNLLS